MSDPTDFVRALRDLPGLAETDRAEIGAIHDDLQKAATRLGMDRDDLFASAYEKAKYTDEAAEALKRASDVVAKALA